MSERFEHHARTMSLLTLVSRVTGLVRDAGLASIFGISPFTDAFNFAFQLPNLFRRLFGEGALSAAFVPRYTELDRDDPERARRYAGLLIGLIAVALWALVVVGELVILGLWLGAPEVQYSAGPAMLVGGVPVVPMSVRYARFAYELAAIMLPYMPMICLVAIGGSALQTHGRFGPTAASPIILNLFMIAAMFGLLPAALAGSVDPAMHLRVVSVAIVLAGVVQAAWTVALLGRLKLRFALRDAMSRASVRATLLAAGPMMLGLGVLQINIVVDGLIASWPSIVGPRILGFDYPLAEGALTAVTNASRLYEFPLGVFGISIATAIFPLLSRQNNDLPAFAASVRRGLRLTVFVGLPASVGLILVAREAVGVLFQRGAFDASDTIRVAWVVVGFAPAIWAYQAIHVLTRGFYALKEPATAVKIALSMVALNLCLNIALIFTPLKEAGLAWSTAICAVLQAGLLARALSRRLEAGGAGTNLVDREVFGGWARTCASASALAVAVVASGYFLPEGFAMRDMALSLAVKVAVGAAAYLAAARVLAMPELWWSLPARFGGKR